MKEKEIEIEPINVLVKHFLNQPYEYTPHRIVGLKYKRKNKPDLLFDDGEKSERWRTKAVLLDTPETRKTLELVNELYVQVKELQDKISKLMLTTTRIDREKLHERVMISKERKGGE